MSVIFGGISTVDRIIFTPSYGQYRLRTAVVIEANKYPVRHALIFRYTGGDKLYQIIKLVNKSYYTLGTLSSLTQPVQLINDFIVRTVPPTERFSMRELK